MANPAKEARDKTQAKWPDAKVFTRRRNSIKHQHPTTLNKFSLDIGVGPLHYGVPVERDDDPEDDDEGIFIDWREIDTEWQAGTAPWDFEMVEAGYNAFALEDFSAGQVVKYVDPISGENISFQPQQLQFTNDLDQIQTIADPQQVNAVATGDVLYWTGAYGVGFDLKWEAQTARLDKRLIVDSYSSLPALEQYIIDGGNPKLRLQFIFAISNDISIYVNDVEWNEQPNNPVETSGFVEFRSKTTDEALWKFNLPRTSDAADNEIVGTFRFRKTGPNLFIEHLIPTDWLSTASYPIEIDVTVDEQVGVGAGDAHELDDGTGFSSTATDVSSVRSNDADTRQNVGFHFPAVDIGQGYTIDVATMEIFVQSNDDPKLDIYGNDVDDAANFTDEADVTSRALTTASVTWDDDSVGYGTETSPSIVTVIQEIVDREGWVADNDMCLLYFGHSGAWAKLLMRSYEHTTSSAAKLHIEFTEVVEFPFVRSSNLSTDVGSSTTSHSAVMPADVEAGDTLLIVIALHGQTSVTWDTGWNELFDHDTGDFGGGSGTLAAGWKKADGDEADTTVTVTSAGGEKSAHASFSIGGATDPSVTPPEASASPTLSSDHASGGPILVEELSVGSGEPDNFLWIGMACSNERDITAETDEIPITAGPEYDGTVWDEPALGTVYRQYRSADYNFMGQNGAWDMVGLEDWVAGMILIHPAISFTPGDAPYYVGEGQESGSDGNITPTIGGSVVENDVMLLSVETSANDSAPAAPSGWTEITGSPTVSSTDAAGADTRLSVFWKRHDGSEVNPTVVDVGEHQIANIIAFRNCITTGDPWDDIDWVVDATADTSLDVPGGESTEDNTLVVHIVSNGDNNFASFDGNTDLTDVQDGGLIWTSSGLDGGVAWAYGTKASAGAYGAATFTMTSAEESVGVTLSLKPAAAGETVTIAGVSVGIAAVTGALSVETIIAGVSAGIAAVTGALSTETAIAGISAGVSSVTGAVSTTTTLAGISAGIAAVTGALSRFKTVAGVSDGISAVTADLSVETIIAGVSAGVSTVTGALSATTAVAGISAGVSAVTGALSAITALAGVSAGIAAVTGTLSRIQFIAGVANGIAAVTGTLSIYKGVAAVSAGIAAVTGALSAITSLAGVSAGIAAVSGALSVEKLLAGVSAGVSTVTGALSAETLIAAVSAGIAAVTAALSITTPPEPDENLVLRSDSDKGETSVDNDLRLRSQASKIVVGDTIEIAGVSVGVGAVTSALGVITSVIGASAGASTVTGDIVMTYAMIGWSHDSASTVTAALAVETTLQTLSAGLATVAGALGRRKSLAGTAVGSAVVTGLLSVVTAIQAISAGIAAVTGALSVSLANTPIAGVSAGISAVTGALSASTRIAGISAGIASVTGTLVRTRPVAAISAGIAAVTGAVSVITALVGLSAGVAVVTGALSRYRGLAGTSVGTSVVAALLSILTALQGVSGGNSIVAGALSATTSLAGLSAGSSSLTASTLSIVVTSLVAVSAGVSVVTGALSVETLLAGISSGVASVSGILVRTKTMAAVSAGISAVTGDASILTALEGLAAGSSTITGALVRTKAIAGISVGASVTTAALSALTTIAGIASGNSIVAAGILSVNTRLAGISAGISTVAGALYIMTAAQLIAGISAGISAVTGFIDVETILLGLSGGVADPTGAMGIIRGARAQVDGTSVPTGDLSVTTTVGGQADGFTTVSGDIDMMIGVKGIPAGQAITLGDLSVGTSIVGLSSGVAVNIGALAVETSVAGVSAGQTSIQATLVVFEFEYDTDRGWKKWLSLGSKNPPQ